MGRPDEPDWHGPFWHLIRSGILDMEPPDHTRVRSLVSKAFTPRDGGGHARADPGDDGRAGRRRRRCRGVRPDRHARRAAAGGGDRGAPRVCRRPIAHCLRPWSADICGMYELRPSEETARTAVRACVEFSDYLRTLSRERRRAEPRDDLISALAQVVDDGERLTEDELIGTCVLLLNAGHEATVNVTGNGWWSLFRNPAQLARLRERAVRWLPRAIEELMRWDTPLQMFERWVLEDSEICGATVPKGAELGLLFGSANRDARRVRRTRTSWTWRESRTRTCRSAPASTSAWARRSRGWSSRRRSPRSCAGCPRSPAGGGTAVEAELHHPRAARAAGGGLSVTRAGVARSKSRRSDSNRRPSDYKSLALPDCATPAGRSESTPAVCAGTPSGCVNESVHDERVEPERHHARDVAAEHASRCRRGSPSDATTSEDPSALGEPQHQDPRQDLERPDHDADRPDAARDRSRSMVPIEPIRARSVGAHRHQDEAGEAPGSLPGR